MLSASIVEEKFFFCLYRDDEVINGVPIISPIVVQGIRSDIGFHPKRIEEIKDTLRELLAELPEKFKEGDTFLNLCMSRDGDLWTGMHQTCDQLMSLAIASGYMDQLFPRELWSALPGEMPFLILKNIQ